MRNKEILIPGTLMRHFKGNLYQILTVALHSETLEEFVVYQALYGEYKTFIRPLDMFLSEVDHEKYPEIKQQYRFEVFDPKKENRSKNTHRPSLNEIIEARNTSIPTDKDTSDRSNQSQLCCFQQKGSQSQEDLEKNNDLLAFLDADTYKEKLEIIDMCKNRINMQMICSIATSMDLVLSTESLENQIEEIRNCILTHMRFEDNRLR